LQCYRTSKPWTGAEPAEMKLREEDTEEDEE